MTLYRGIGRRIVIAALVVAIGSGMTVFGANRMITRRVVHQGFFRAIDAPNVERALARCDRSPDRFVYTDPAGLRYYAYQPTGEPLSPNAPPIEAALLQELHRGDARPYRLRPRRFVAIFSRPDKPCALILAVRSPRRVQPLKFVLVSGVSLLATLVLSWAFVWTIVVRPLRRRIQSVRRSASAVGQVETFESSRRGVNDELEELSLSIDEAHRRLLDEAEQREERERRMDEFFANVAHDLRTPMTAMRLALEALEDDSAAEKDEERRTLVETALAEAVYMSSLVENLRLAGRLREGWDPMADAATLDLAELVDRVAKREALFAERKGVSLAVSVPDDPVPVRANATMTERGITNVVENAVAYGSANGHVAVTLTDGPEGFVLIVEDDGPGVRPAEIPRLSDRTFRADKRNRSPKGSGLGLAITAELAERSQWSLHFEPVDPCGLRVRLSEHPKPPPRKPEHRE